MSYKTLRGRFPGNSFSSPLRSIGVRGLFIMAIDWNDPTVLAAQYRAYCIERYEESTRVDDMNSGFYQAATCTRRRSDMGARNEPCIRLATPPKDIAASRTSRGEMGTLLPALVAV